MMGCSPRVLLIFEGLPPRASMQCRATISRQPAHLDLAVSGKGIIVHVLDLCKCMQFTPIRRNLSTH